MAQAPQRQPQKNENAQCFYGDHNFIFTYCGSPGCRTVALKRAGCYITGSKNVSCPGCSGEWVNEYMWAEVARLVRNCYHCPFCAAVGVPAHPPWWFENDGAPQNAVAEAVAAAGAALPPPPPQRAPPQPAPPGLAQQVPTHEQRIRALEETVEALSGEVERLLLEVVALRAEQALPEGDDAAVALPEVD